MIMEENSNTLLWRLRIWLWRPNILRMLIKDLRNLRSLKIKIRNNRYNFGSKELGIWKLEKPLVLAESDAIVEYISDHFGKDPNARLGYEGQNATDIKGGMTIYYTQKDFDSNGNQHITAFPPGFRMTVGSPTINDKNDSKKGIAYTCLQTILTRGNETPDFPTKPCPAGIMAIHHFPACWDGKNTDSPDHQSHMFSTTKGGFREAGPCPASHPVRVPQVAYETMWDTTVFKDMWPKDGSQPFVWSFMDGKGYGTHADYVFGWKGDSLQRAMNDSCMFHKCGSPGIRGLLKTQTVPEMNKCAAVKEVQEDVDGWLTELPGQKMEM
ncbi:hypothetical protein N0V90_011842 [Kalmusia sp. IMI 367209]|nr:hypothetical protein N0V90_011842 [Kalmusia sp. IMI 367209]